MKKKRYNFSNVLNGPDAIPSINLLFSAMDEIDEEFKEDENGDILNSDKPREENN